MGYKSLFYATLKIALLDTNQYLETPGFTFKQFNIAHKMKVRKIIF